MSRIGFPVGRREDKKSAAPKAPPWNDAALTLSPPSPIDNRHNTTPSTTGSDLNAWLQSRLPHASLSSVYYLVDFALLALPQVALTMATAAAPAAPAFASVLALWLALLARRRPARLLGLASGGGSNDDDDEVDDGQTAAAAAAAVAALAPLGGRRACVGAFRGGLMLLTCVSILAVDFRAFPRRLAKAERYGQGLMDVGVGAFVFAAGLVMQQQQRQPRQEGGGKGGGGGGGSARKRRQEEEQTTPRRSGGAAAPPTTPRRSARLQERRREEEEEEEVSGGASPAARRAGGGRARSAQTQTTTTALAGRLAKSLRASAPVAALGLARLLTTKATHYAEHVGEYGVHWNFFLTVAAVGALSAALPPAATATAGRAALGSAALLALHQALLSLTPLGAWVQAEARGPGWISLNKEGLASLPGYWGLLLLGAAAGGALRSACAAAAEEASVGGGGGAPRALRRLLGRASLLTGALWLLALASDALIERVSRRACNAAYALWVAALCASALVACMAAEAAVAAGGEAEARHALAASASPRRQARRRPLAPGRPAPPTPAAPPFSAAAIPSAPPLPLSPCFAPLLRALSRNMLALFLAANLLTGAVNLLTDTLSAGPGRARGTVAAYAAALCAVAALLDARGVTTTRFLMRG